MVFGGAKMEDPNCSGISTSIPIPWTAWAVFMASPSTMKIHMMAAPNTADSATASRSPSTDVPRDMPRAKPIASRMMMATIIRPSSTTILAMSTEERAIGIVRNRSMTPLRKSSLTPVPTAMAMFMPIIAISPGTR